MREIIVVVGVVLIGALALARPLQNSNPTEQANDRMAQSIATNTSANVTYASLNAEWLAANNQTKKDACITRLFAKLAGLEAELEKAKAASRQNAGKPNNGHQGGKP